MIDGPANPLEAARRKARAPLPRRFYKSAAAVPADGGFAVALDGRVAKTPAGKPLGVSSLHVATALAAEWEAQREVIDHGAMPLTRIVNAAIDRVAAEMAAVRSDIVAYAGNDLICYRASEPDGLVEVQNRIWNPLVVWARESLNMRLVLAEGVVHVAQAPAALEALGDALRRYDAVALAALHTATTLAGSAIIALALARGRLAIEEAWTAAHVDEDWQMTQWGTDETAMTRRAARLREFEAAALILVDTRSQG
jgi:chaperone required for assembly of F1-ATPase